MSSPTSETEIPSDICFPTWETHIPSDMWYELMWCLTRFYQLNKCRCRCVPLPGKHLSLVICVPLPGKHISLVICFFLPRKHISLVTCVPLLGKQVSLVICVPLLMLWEVFPQGIASFLFLFRIPDRTICFVICIWFCCLSLSIRLFCMLPPKFRFNRCYHVWQLLLTWIEPFISIVICLPLPAPPGNTGWLLSLILRLLKIFWQPWIGEDEYSKEFSMKYALPYLLGVLLLPLRLFSQSVLI